MAVKENSAHQFHQFQGSSVNTVIVKYCRLTWRKPQVWFQSGSLPFCENFPSTACIWVSSLWFPLTVQKTGNLVEVQLRWRCLNGPMYSFCILCIWSFWKMGFSSMEEKTVETERKRTHTRTYNLHEEALNQHSTFLPEENSGFQCQSELTIIISIVIIIIILWLPMIMKTR